jgi:hypothetical protein
MAMTKVLGQEEELAGFAKIAGQEEELALAKSSAGTVLRKEQESGCGPGCGCALCAPSDNGAAPIEDQYVQEAVAGASVATATAVPPDTATLSTVSRVALSVKKTEVAATSENRLAVGAEAVNPMAKAVLDVQSGATGSVALQPKTYGMTFPERVEAGIGAKLDAGTKTWKPVVKSLTGHYSQRVRLLPGQAEITGVGGNTTKANFCAQCESLEALGNLPVSSHPWYIIAAVVAHENVHATRFKPGLEDAEAAMTTAIEAVSVPHVDPMGEVEAIAKLQADAGYQAAVKQAYRLWLAKCAARVAGDHAAGGPTDAAEKAITDPLRTTICAHAAAQKWPTCPACPAPAKKPWWKIW